MKTQALGLFAILSLGVGVVGISSAMFQESSDMGSYGEVTPVSGHVTVIHKDPQGSILSYQQYDNVIVNQGFNCASEVLFATTNATCAAVSQTGQFNQIGLLGSSPVPQIEWTRASGAIPVTGGGLTAAVATTIGTDVEATGTGTTQTGVTVGIQKTFTKTNATAATIGGAVLLNTAQDAAFAAKAFTGGNVVLNENDTLLITWSITLGSP